MSQTHWKKLKNPDYIGAYSLTPGEDLTVTIKAVRKQIVKGTGGAEQECMVATLDGQKPIIVNSTNGKTIAKLYGPYIEDWAGKQITLYGSTTSVAGEQVECLRIRPTKPGPKAKPVINEDRFSKALAQIEAGQFSAAQLVEKFELSTEQLDRLPKQIEGATE